MSALAPNATAAMVGSTESTVLSTEIGICFNMLVYLLQNSYKLINIFVIDDGL